MPEIPKNIERYRIISGKTLLMPLFWAIDNKRQDVMIVYKYNADNNRAKGGAFTLG